MNVPSSMKSHIRFQNAATSKLRRLLMLCLLAGALSLAAPRASHAQGPNLPRTPEQTPIDMGLGALALAGGAFAMKRLRGRKGGESQE